MCIKMATSQHGNLGLITKCSSIVFLQVNRHSSLILYLNKIKISYKKQYGRDFLNCNICQYQRFKQWKEQRSESEKARERLASYLKLLILV